MNTKLKVVVPLLLAVALTAVFVLLALQVAQDDDPGSSVAAERRDPPTTLDSVPTAIPRVPQNVPGETITYQQERFERFGGRYPRWNIRDFPAGWDHELASDIHAFFEAMAADPDESRPDLQQIRAELSEFLAQLGPEALPTLAAILDAEPDWVDRRFLLYAVGAIGPQSEEATLVLKDFFLARYQQAGSHSEMIHAIDSMGLLQNDTAFDTLTDFTARAGMHSFRPKLIEVLGDHPRREEALGSVVGYLHDDPLATVRNKAAQFLGKVKNGDSLDEVYRAVEKESHWVVKQTLLGTVGKIANPNSVAFLENHARNAPEAGVRLSAARALSRLGTPHADRVLREVARSEPDPKVRGNMEKWFAED